MMLRHPFLLGVIVVLTASSASATQAAGWITLNDSMCKPIAASAALPEAWSKYRESTRICSLARNDSQVAQVSLVSVFVDDYYRGLPKDAPWESFPMPMLVDPSGRCLAQLSHLFPSEPPSRLVVQAGGWKNGVPTLLRFNVLNPAVDGNYRLPSMKWDEQTKRYLLAATKTITTTSENLCP